MKTLLLTLFFFTSSLCSALAQTDEAAIRQIIESESKAFHLNADRKVFTTYWHVTNDNRMIYTDPTGTFLFRGDEMKTAMAKGELPPADNATSEFSNFVVKASGTVGWATFDQKNTTPDGKSVYTREFRCMEKIDGAWKIFSSSIHDYKP